MNVRQLKSIIHKLIMPSLPHFRKVLYLPSNSHNERHFSFCWNIVISLVPSLASETNFIAFLCPVLLDVLFSPLENFNSLVPMKSSLLQIQRIIYEPITNPSMK